MELLPECRPTVTVAWHNLYAVPRAESEFTGNCFEMQKTLGACLKNVCFDFTVFWYDDLYSLASGRRMKNMINRTSPPQSHLGRAASPPLIAENRLARCVLAVQCPLQTSPIIQPRVRHISSGIQIQSAVFRQFTHQTDRHIVSATNLFQHRLCSCIITTWLIILSYKIKENDLTKNT